MAHGAENSGPGGDHGGNPHDEKFNIWVNGDPVIWRERKISYKEVVELAFPDDPKGGDIRYSVTWTKPDGSEGSMRRGDKVDVAEGMIFHVRNTDKS